MVMLKKAMISVCTISVLSSKFSTLQKFCCDPFNKHSKAVKTSLTEITIQEVKSHEQFNLMPDKKLCSMCCCDVFTVKSVVEEEEKFKNSNRY